MLQLFYTVLACVCQVFIKRTCVCTDLRTRSCITLVRSDVENSRTCREKTKNWSGNSRLWPSKYSRPTFWKILCVLIRTFLKLANWGETIHHDLSVCYHSFSPRSFSTSQLLSNLHWLPIHKWINFKDATRFSPLNNQLISITSYVTPPIQSFTSFL